MLQTGPKKGHILGVGATGIYTKRNRYRNVPKDLWFKNLHDAGSKCGCELNNLAWHETMFIYHKLTFSALFGWFPILKVVISCSDFVLGYQIIYQIKGKKFFFLPVQRLCLYHASSLPWGPSRAWVMCHHIEILWDFMKWFSRIEFSKKVLMIQQGELNHVKLDKICYWRHLFWTQLLLLIMEISSWKEQV